MGILNKTSVYLAGAMQFTEDGESWRDMVTKELEPLNIKVYNPYIKPFLDSKYLEGKLDQDKMNEWVKAGRLDLVAEKMRHIRISDLYICDISTFGIFYLNPNIYTVGTIEELSTMNKSKRPCFVLWDSDKPCFWLLGMLKPQYIYRKWSDLIQTIKNIDNGTLQPDSTRWKLLSQEWR
jgi:hypothetical protein